MEFDFEYVPIRLETKPTGAEAYIGTKRLGITPLELEYRVGNVDIIFKHGGKDFVRQVKVRKEKALQRFVVDLTEPAHGTAMTVGGMEFVYIRGGEFWMGSKESPTELAKKYGGESSRYAGENPLHRVEVSGFWMGKYEVTQAQYKSIMGKNPSYFRGFWGGSQRPVEQVSWHDAKDFCAKFGAKHGVPARLPYEAEWEYAARAGTSTAYYWGDTIDGNYCWYGGNSNGTTHPVGEKRPNAWGLYDMAGNVREWCEDWYDATYYSRSPKKNPMGPETGSSRVLRGGSWDEYTVSMRSASRCWSNPGYWYSYCGFRVVVVASP